MRVATKKWYVSIFSCSLLLLVMAFVLTSCGDASSTSTNSGGTGSNGPALTPTVAKTPAINPTATAAACATTVSPSSTSKADLTVQINDDQKTLSAKQGNIVEVRLPASNKWTGPTGAMSTLDLQKPGGYLSNSDHTCVWRFVAKGTGNSVLNFEERPICAKGKMCPLYVVAITFTIAVK